MTPNSFMQFQADSFRAANDMLTKSAGTFQQVAALNANFGKSVTEQYAQQMQALIAAKDADAVTKVVTDSAKPNAELMTYLTELGALATEAGTEWAAAAQEHVASSNEKFDEAMDAFAKNAPAGSEGAIAVMRQCVAASRAAYQQANDAGKNMNAMFTSMSQGATESAAETK